VDRPLAGLRVVALEQAIALPFGSWILAEMGANVIKIERPGRGDVVRGWDTAIRGLSSGYVWVNGGKRDVVVDVGKPAGRDVVRRLVVGADVFLENFTPGAAGRLGLAYADLKPDNPRLIYLSLSGYGQDGPYRTRKAYDLLMQGETGLIQTTGEPDAPAKIGPPITDLIAGSYAALAVVLALRDRDRTGEGTEIDLAIFDSVASWLGYYPLRFWESGEEPPRTGMRHQYLVPYGPYKAADGRLVNVVVASEDDWKRFCELVVMRPLWLVDVRFASADSRRLHRADLESMVESAIAEQPSGIWMHRLEASELPFGEVRTIGEVVSHPQLKARDMIARLTSQVGDLSLIRFPLASAKARRHLPALGEHSREVLLEAGYSEVEISELSRQGAVGVRPDGAS
jgi:crotonobetainyl-CoA:carnitine CoA-transferase CaiB-like acyl-CoA transferase